MRSIRFVGLTLVLVGLVASACGGTTPRGGASAAPSQATVTKDLIIGFTASQTGAQNVTSKRQTDGIQLWVDDVTKAGGIKLKDDPTIKKVAIVNEKDSSSASVVAAPNPYAKSKGLDVVVAEGYDTGTTDFNPFINKIQAASPDAIIGGGHFEDGTTFAKQLFEKRVNARFVALLVAPPEPTFKDIGDAAQFIVGPSQWEPAAKYSAETAKAANVPYFGPTPKEFTDRYVAKYSSQPSYQSAGGYAAGLVLQKALEDAGSNDPAKMQAALDKIDLMLFYGRVKFSLDAKTHGKQIAHDMVYVQWQKGADGKLATQLVWPSDAATAPAQLRK